jgi:hypothetical protein
VAQAPRATLRSETRFEEHKWRANWFNIMGSLLEEYYKIEMKGLRIFEQKDWHLQNSLDYFPGYYFFNCMTQLIARKGEIERNYLDMLESGGQPISIEGVKHKQSAFIGKDYQIFDNNKPISSDRYEETMTQYKLQLES